MRDTKEKFIVNNFCGYGFLPGWLTLLIKGYGGRGNAF
jgi:hypothetical protein